MNRTVTCCAWLLALVMGSSTLAQTQPKKRSNKHAAEQEEVPVKSLYRYPPPSSSQGEPPYYYNNQVPFYVDQMPALNGQNALAVSGAAIQQYLVVPPGAPGGRLSVCFEVDETGRVRHPQILKGVRADVDSAVVAAVRQLPRFSPGKKAGQAVTVSLIVLVIIPTKKKL